MNIRRYLELYGYSSPTIVTPTNWNEWLTEAFESSVHGGHVRTMLLTQMSYYWENNGHKAFKKLIARPEKYHKDYKPGQSWREILSVGKSAWNTALYGTEKRDPIATKLTDDYLSENNFRGVTHAINTIFKTSEKKEHLILFRTTSDHVTWWYLNEDLVVRKLNQHRIAMKKKYNKIIADLNVPEEDTLANIHDDFLKENEDERQKVEVAELASFTEKKLPMPEVKAKKQPSQAQLNMMFGHPLDTSHKIPDNIIAAAIEAGYDAQGVMEEALNFVHHYSLVNTKVKSMDWDGFFLHSWVPQAYGYGRVKRYGKYKDGVTEKKSTGDVFREFMSQFESV
jgi:hypothetical protein